MASITPLHSKNREARIKSNRAVPLRRIVQPIPVEPSGFPDEEPIPVTRPFLPPSDLYKQYIQGTFDRNWLTNDGELVQELQMKLENRLEVPELLYVSNGTIALQLAIKALQLTGEVITTPFTFIATASSLAWEGCKPVFVDIEKENFNLDPDAIEAAITPETTGIVATHCFGWPCRVDAISNIAKKHGLKVIYDGAHAFGTSFHGESIFKFGDLTTCSFHATKLYHTVEGGSISGSDPEVMQNLRWMRNFGHLDHERFATVGINAKNSEVHAAMGLSNFYYIDDILTRRRGQARAYAAFLKGADLMHLNPENKDWNCSYFPIVLRSERECLALIEELKSYNIQPRRYFYPSLNKVNNWSTASCPNAEEIASRVLCLPMYYDLKLRDVQRIADIIRSFSKGYSDAP